MTTVLSQAPAQKVGQTYVDSNDRHYVLMKTTSFVGRAELIYGDGFGRYFVEYESPAHSNLDKQDWSIFVMPILRPCLETTIASQFQVVILT